jgi:anti-sigma-K factor RskA
MSERDDIDALAGEYVLGTLDAAERRAADARRLREPALDTAIQATELRLAPLIVNTRAVAPPPDLFRRIEAEITRASAVAPPLTVASNVLDLQRSVTRWRRMAIGASALAASLALFSVFRDQVLPPKPQSFVAAFVKNDELPQFMLTVDLASRELTIRPIGADRLQGKTYQLWITSEQIGPPRSLGVLDDGSSPLQRKSLDAYDRGQLQNATFGVSIEQAGGSPTGRPSAGALHAKLLPAKP